MKLDDSRNSNYSHTNVVCYLNAVKAITPDSDDSDKSGKSEEKKKKPPKKTERKAAKQSEVQRFLRTRANLLNCKFVTCSKTSLKNIL